VLPMSEDIEKEKKAFRSLLEIILWKARLQDEIIYIYNLYFQAPDTLKFHKQISKSAINSAVNYLRTIPQLQNIYYGSPINETGGIMLVSSDDKDTDNILVTERGFLLHAKSDIKKYMEVNRLL